MIPPEEAGKAKKSKPTPAVSGRQTLLITSQLVYFCSSYSDMPITPKQKSPCNKCKGLRTEREGFEPSIRFPVYTISSRAPSAKLGHLSKWKTDNKYNSRKHDCQDKKILKNHLKNLPAICQRPSQAYIRWWALGRHPRRRQKVLPRPVPFWRQKSKPSPSTFIRIRE